ncbi:hypothetical protein [Kribbella sp. NBC_00359]|uniref:hypothetical protein n=1 Tax=Kribbella sp. NBC_00359 TaxID=2975966 RepID=UPI002E1BE0BF
MSGVQLDLFGQVADYLDAAERQQDDWRTWLQDESGRWACPACGDVESTAEELHVRHGFRAELSATGHPYHYAWPGRYAEGGYSGNGGRCKKLRTKWLQQHYGEWPPGPTPGS